MSRRALVVWGVMLALATAPFFNIIYGWSPSVAALANFTAVGLIGLNIIFGMLGLHALGQAAFSGVCGYAAGILLSLAVPEQLALPAAIVVTVLVARMLAIIFVRLPGNYFAFGTLGFAFMVEGLARAFPDVTGGASGLVFTAPFRLTSVQWYALSLAALAGAALVYWLTVRDAYARRLHAVRSDELAAEVLGIDVMRVKTNAFTIGGAYAAFAGLFLSYFVGVLVPESAGVERSLELVVMVMIGGAGVTWGPIIGAWLIVWLTTAAGAAGVSNNLEVFVYGLCFFVASMFARGGIAGLVSMRSAPPAVRWRPDDTVTQPVPRATPKPTAPGEPVLRVRNLTKAFGGVRAVERLDLDVERGEVVVLIGPNGAGKTTVLNLLSGLEHQDNGRIWLGGTDITSKPVYARAKLMGRSFQVARLVPELTVIENVVIRLDQLGGDQSETKRLHLAMQQLERFGLDLLAHAPLSSLSAGQQKVIDVLRSFLGEPQLLMLDEPAVGLTRKELADLSSMILEMRRSTAILVVEHNFRFVEQIADRAIVLDRGRIIASGLLAEVTSDRGVRAAYYGALA